MYVITTKMFANNNILVLIDFSEDNLSWDYLLSNVLSNSSIIVFANLFIAKKAMEHCKKLDSKYMLIDEWVYDIKLFKEIKHLLPKNIKKGIIK